MCRQRQSLDARYSRLFPSSLDPVVRGSDVMGAAVLRIDGKASGSCRTYSVCVGYTREPSLITVHTQLETASREQQHQKLSGLGSRTPNRKTNKRFEQRDLASQEQRTKTKLEPDVMGRAIAPELDVSTAAAAPRLPISDPTNVLLGLFGLYKLSLRLRPYAPYHTVCVGVRRARDQGYDSIARVLP